MQSFPALQCTGSYIKQQLEYTLISSLKFIKEPLKKKLIKSFYFIFIPEHKMMQKFGKEGISFHPELKVYIYVLIE